MSHITYTADQLVEQPALQLLAELGWQVSNARDEVLGTTGTLGHRTRDRWLPRLLAGQLDLGE